MRKAKREKKRAAKRPTAGLDRAGRRGGVPSWKDLTVTEQRRVARLMIRSYAGLVKFAAGKYNIVSSAKHRALRDRPQIEFGGEDDALTHSLRMQFINLARNGVRNNETLNGILEQLKNNSVGVEGGKAHFDFGERYTEAAKWLRREFAAHASACEFFTGTSLNEVLKIILQTVVICGDCAVVFDNMIDDSGTVMVFEPDSIVNYPAALFKARFPGYTQVQGRIKNLKGVFCGITVSSSERGRAEATDPSHCLFFTKKPHSNPLDEDWLLVGPQWRSNQGRGTPQIASPLASLIDTADLLGFEKESAKKNSQMYAQLIQTGADGGEADSSLGDPAERGTKWEEDGGELAEGVVEATDIPEEEVTFEELEAAGAFYDVMPANSKLELLDTKHPNPNMNEFIRLVECRGGWALGLCSCFVTGRVDKSFSGYRGEQLMTWPVFFKWQKFLERICDWLIRAWFRWMKAAGRVPAEIVFPDDWQGAIKWFWPTMKEVNPVDAQATYDRGLKNGTMLLSEINGPDWKEKARRHAEEVRLYRDLNLVHPADETASGQVVEPAKGGEGAGSEERDNDEGK